MNVEVKVGQVWNDPYFGEIKVITKENYQVVFQKVDGKFIILNIKSPEWGKYLTLMRDVETKLTDLEIVQKAVECSGGYLWLDSEGCWQIEGNTNIIGGGISSLLTWAKQTTGGGVMDIERFDLFDCHGEYVGNRDVESIVAQRDELLAKLEDESVTIEGTVNLYKSLVKDLEEKLAAMESELAELRAYKEAAEK